MKKCCFVTMIVLYVLMSAAFAQTTSSTSFRLGATVSFGLSSIAANDVGIGGIAGAEKKFSTHFAAEAETSYTYFTGDKMVYTDGENKAFAIPVTAGVKYYPLANVYGSLRAGAVLFLFNNMPSTKIRPAWGIAGGLNLPQKVNRLNIQLGYTGFRYDGINRGYATLAAAIIMN